MQKDQPFEKLEKEKTTTAKMEAVLADLCFTLQHYQTMFVESEKLLGIESVGIENLDEHLKILFEKLTAFTETNRVLEDELAELENHDHLLEDIPRHSRVELEEVWRLYDVVNVKLGDIDILRSRISELKKRNLSKSFSKIDDDTAAADVLCPLALVRFPLEIKVSPHLSQRKLLGEVSNTFLSTSTDLPYFQGESLSTKKKKKRSPRIRLRWLMHQGNIGEGSSKKE